MNYSDYPSGYSEEERETCITEGQLRYIDIETGEYQKPVQSEIKDYPKSFLEALLDFKDEEILKEYLEEYHGENTSNEKIMWCNSAVDDLFEMKGSSANYFRLLGSCITTRNVVFMSSKDIAKKLGIDARNLNRTLTPLKECGKILEVPVSVHSGRKGYRLIFLDPKIVWKGYLHHGAKDVEDNLNYSSRYRFSSLHKHYVDMWIRGVFHKLVKGGK